jgi:hypothetical protein
MGSEPQTLSARFFGQRHDMAPHASAQRIIRLFRKNAAGRESAGRAAMVAAIRFHRYVSLRPVFSRRLSA